MLLVVTNIIHAQVILQEDFEAPSFDDKVAQNSNWLITNSLSLDSNSFHNGPFTAYPQETYFDLLPIDISSYTNAKIILEFDHIAKSSFFDMCVPGVLQLNYNPNGSIDTSFQSLDTSYYFGQGSMLFPIISFCEISYVPDWDPLTTTIPTASWWRHETIVIPNASQFIGNASNGMLSFRFWRMDAGVPTADGRYGWVIDNIQVSVSLSTVVSDSEFPVASTPFFPNPCPANGTLNFQDELVGYQINIFDLQGKQVLSQNISKNDAIELSSMNLNSGIYVLQAIKDSKTQSWKLLIQ